MSLIRKHVAVLQAWACLALVLAMHRRAGLHVKLTKPKIRINEKHPESTNIRRDICVISQR